MNTIFRLVCDVISKLRMGFCLTKKLVSPAKREVEIPEVMLITD